MTRRTQVPHFGKPPRRPANPCFSSHPPSLVVPRPGSGLEPGRVAGGACAVIAVTSGLGPLTVRAVRALAWRGPPPFRAPALVGVGGGLGRYSAGAGPASSIQHSLGPMRVAQVPTPTAVGRPPEAGVRARRRRRCCAIKIANTPRRVPLLPSRRGTARS